MLSDMEDQAAKDIPLDGDSRAISDRGVDNTAGITKSFDDMGVIKVSAAKEIWVAPSVTSAKRFPVKSEEQVDALNRVYPIADIVIPTTAAFGDELAAFSFPEDAFNPTIVARVARNKFFRGGVKLTLRFNGNINTTGLLFISYLPFYDGASANWRTQQWGWVNLPHTLMSLSSSSTVTIEYPFDPNVNSFDLQQLEPKGCVGLVRIHVFQPLAIEGPSPPASMVLSGSVQLIEPELSGPDINSYTSLPKIKSKKHLYLKDQSSDATSKAASDVMASVRKDVEGVFALVEKVAPVVGAFLDKPTQVNMPVRAITVQHPDSASGEGVDVAIPLATRSVPYVSTKNPLVREYKPQPTIVELAKIPQFVARMVVNTTYTVAAPLIDLFPVTPAKVFNPESGVFCPGFPGLLAITNRKWRGTARYFLVVESAQINSWRLRIFALPSEGLGVAVLSTDKGDVPSIIRDINGFTTIKFSVRWDASYYAKSNNGFNIDLTDPIYSLGRIQFQVEVPMRTNVTTSAGMFLYMSMDDDADFWEPMDVEHDLVPDYSDPIPPAFTLPRKKLTVKMEDQSCVRDEFLKNDFPPIVPCDYSVIRGVLHGDAPKYYTDLLKKYTLEHYACAIGTGTYWAQVAQPSSVVLGFAAPKDNVTPSKILLMAPFLGYSGGTCWKFIPAGGSVPMSVELADGDMLNGVVSEPPRGLAGHLFANTNQFTMSFMVPYSGEVSYWETFETHNFSDPLTFIVKNPTGGVTSTFNIYMAMADDVSLYFPLAPPIFLEAESNRFKRASLAMKAKAALNPNVRKYKVVGKGKDKDT
jgi:hypothetical protein